MSEARIAVVTGGASGIGAAIATALAAAGHSVVVADIDTGGADRVVDHIATAGHRAITIRLDVTSAESVTDAKHRIDREFGGADILVNCAGWDRFRKFLDTDEDFWHQVLDLNFTGVLRTCHTFAPGMVDRGWGRIVNISSDAGRVGSSLEAVYSGAKGATIAFSKTLARELARNGVTVNVVCPGPTDTPLLGAIASEAADADKVINAMAGATAMKRLGAPEEIAPAVVYFCSDGAAFTTGQTLSVSGGLTMV